MPFSPAILFFGAAFILIIALYLGRTRRFYFVRHGETLLNAKRIKQGEEGSLSPKGLEQAEQVGKFLKQFPIESIITSTYPRARETALTIKKHLHSPVIYSALFAERRNPSELIGKHVDDPLVVRTVEQMDLSFHEDDYRFSDEESFLDLKKRARLCLNLLAHQGAQDTCIVTHHVFLKILIAYLLYRENLHAADFVKLAFFNVSDNAGITVCEFHPWRIFSRTRGWKVVTYNAQPS